MRLSESIKSYRTQLQNKFGQIINMTQLPNQYQSIAQYYIPVPKFQILSSSYPMQKKGKNFNTLQQRTFTICNFVLQQIDKNNKKKNLPYPTSITRQIYSENKHQWGFQIYPFRLLLQFTQRNPIYVYTKTKQQSNQLYLFLLSKSNTKIKLLFTQLFHKYYKNNIVKYFMEKLTKKLILQQFQSVENQRLMTIQKIKYSFNNDSKLKQMIIQWHRKSVMSNQYLQYRQQNTKTSWISTKSIVSQFTFNLDQIRTIQQYKLQKGQIKLWLGEKLHHKTLQFDQLFHMKNTSHNPYQSIKIFNLTDNYIKIINQKPPLLNIWTVLQFQIDALTNFKNVQVWKSQRFYLIDLIKNLTLGPKKTITLFNNKKFIQLMITVTSAKTQAIKIDLPPQHETFPSSYTYKFTPNHYPILRQLIPKQILKKYIRSLSPENIHLQYIVAYQQYLQTQSIHSLHFSIFQRLYQLLGIDTIIQTIYTIQPYNQYINIAHRGTFIYELLVKKASKFLYYDAQKFIWKFQCTNFRRFLSVIKAFDQFPRINYTQPFYNICLQCLKISQKQSLLKWKPQLFDNTLLGRQSLAFFLVLGISKLASQLLLHQNNKKILSNNSLLFHYILKKHSRNLYNKFLQIQLNIQALFGIQSASIFSGLLTAYSANTSTFYGGSDQIFLFAIKCFVQQRDQFKLPDNQQKDNSPYKHQSQLYPIRSNHYISLIAIFLSIIQLFDNVISKLSNPTILKSKSSQNGIDEIVGDSAAYSSAHCYIQYLRIFCRTKLQQYLLELTLLYSKYYDLCQQQFTPKSTNKPISQYLILQQSLDKFHTQCHPSSTQNIIITNNQSLNRSTSEDISTINLGQLLEQLYSQFMCSKQKNQADIRKIFILIDNINLGQLINIHNIDNLSNSSSFSPNMSSGRYKPPSLFVQLLQNGYQIYSHELVFNDENKHVTNMGSNQKIDQNDDLNSAYINTTILNYQNLKHAIQLKLHKLSPIHLIITYNSNDLTSTLLSFQTIIDPISLPSNYYLQLIKQLSPIILTNISNKQHIKQNIQQYKTQQKISDIKSCRYICMQIYVKDSCDVDYLDKMVPDHYINLLLLKNRISNQQHHHHKDTGQLSELQQYKKDIIFCNTFFREFRLPENNFNLLYAKLGWYGNHYLIPTDRINSLYFITHTPPVPSSPLLQFQSTNDKVVLNHQPSLAALIQANTSQIQIKNMPPKYKQRINQILFYTRCIYGKGLIPSITYPTTHPNNTSNGTTSIIMSSTRSNTIPITQFKQLKHQNFQYQYNSCSNFVGYVLDNFTTINCNNTKGNDGFIYFYLRAVQELPLLRYLTFRNLQFYLLQQIKMTLRIQLPKQTQYDSVPIHHSINQPHHAKQKHHNSPGIGIFGCFPNKYKQKQVVNVNSVSPVVSPQSTHKNSSDSPLSNYTPNKSNKELQIEQEKIFQIVFTNFHIGKSVKPTHNKTHKHAKQMDEQLPNKFITDPIYFNPQFYSNFQIQKQTSKSLYNPKYLYTKIIQGIQLPQTMYFTYPQGLFQKINSDNIENIDGLNGIGGLQTRQLLLDQFLWFLKMNIIKYYIIDKKNKQHVQKQTILRQDSKNKSKKQNKTKYNPDLDCHIKISNGNFTNIPMSSFFQFICQTKYSIDLITVPILPLLNSQYTSPNKSSPPIIQYPLILNPVYRHYTSYANLNNLWINVCILARIVSPNYLAYYTQQKYTRKYRLYRNTEIILGIEGKRLMDRIPVFQFTDYQLITGKECVRKQLLKIL